MTNSDNWAKVTVGLITFAFINLLLFIVLSNPMGLIFDMIDTQAGNMGVEDKVVPHISNYRNVFGLTFLLSMAGLIVWFILGAHKEEHEEY